ncbi:MAG TPA: NAD(P)H dehydrogenase [Bacteroidales bacterium]|nr:NAD(P)H dehydrogenase [Bacteroidales bacterium]
MHHLIIYSNHQRNSFLKLILEEVVRQYQNRGDSVTIRDLYQMKFNPVLTNDDLSAIHSGIIPKDILTEQQLVMAADFITMIYPVWWTGMPAILKGYIDRIFSYGFAYGDRGNGVEGFLKGKKAIIFSTTGQPHEEYQANGMYNAMNMTTDKGIFEFCDIDVLDHIYFPEVPHVSKQILIKYLNSIEKILSTCFIETLR